MKALSQCLTHGRVLLALKVFFLLCLASCGHALPSQNAPEQVEDSLRRAEAAAARADTAANQARVELKKAEVLLNEARSLSQAAQDASGRCVALTAKVPKYRKCHCPPCKPAETEAQPDAKPKGADPAYSTSDAPL